MKQHPLYRRMAMLGLGVAVLLFLVRPMYSDNSEVGAADYEELASVFTRLDCSQAVDYAKIGIKDERLTNSEARLVRAALEYCRTQCGAVALREGAEKQLAKDSFKNRCAA